VYQNLELVPSTPPVPLPLPPPPSHHHHHHNHHHRHQPLHCQLLSSENEKDDDEDDDEGGGNKMTFVNKLSKSFRWLRCSTLCAILFYMFFIGLILHSTSTRLQQQLKEQGSSSSSSKSSSSSSSSITQADTKVAPNVGHNGAQRWPNSLQELEQQQKHEAKLRSQPVANNLDPGNEYPQHQAEYKPPPQKVQSAAASNASKSPNQPETVILAASNVNEKQILAKAFKR